MLLSFDRAVEKDAEKADKVVAILVSVGVKILDVFLQTLILFIGNWNPKNLTRALLVHFIDAVI